MIIYNTFDLHIVRDGADFQLLVSESPSGQAAQLLSAKVVDQLTQQSLSAQLQPKEFGAKLYKEIFQGDVGRLLDISLALTKQAFKGLRIRLHLSQGISLQQLAWEYLYDPKHGFFSTSKQTPIVRYLALPEPERPPIAQLPIHILAVLSNPKDFSGVHRLDIETEWSALKNAIAPLEQTGKVVLERLCTASLSALQQRIRQRDVTIMHFFGRGSFDDKNEKAALLMEDSEGMAKHVVAEDLWVRVRDNPPQLIYLNSCETALSGVNNPLTGTAHGLVQVGVPAVIAMQQKILSTAAHTIVAEFYRALCEGYPVDAALSEGRMAAYHASEYAEWGTPVLFMRSSNGKILGDIKGTQQRKALPIDPSVIDLNQLTEKLLKCESMTNNALRNLIVNDLPPKIRNIILRIPVLKADVRNIAKSCLNYENGIESLIAAMEVYEEDANNLVEVKLFVGSL